MFVQSFEVSNLRELARRVKVPLVQLTSATGRPYDFTANGDPRTYVDLTTPDGCGGSHGYADGIGPDKNLIIPRDAQHGCSHRRPWSTTRTGRTDGAPVDLPRGEQLHGGRPPERRPREPEFLRARGNEPAEFKLFFKLGVDGVFADNPDTAVAVRHKLFGRR